MRSYDRHTTASQQYRIAHKGYPASTDTIQVLCIIFYRFTETVSMWLNFFIFIKLII